MILLEGVSHGSCLMPTRRTPPFTHPRHTGMVKYNDHAFVTFAQSGELSKPFALELLKAHGAEGAMIVQENHAEEGVHLHAAIFGQFRSDRFAQNLHDALPGKHVDIMFSHKNKNSGAKGRGPLWPFVEMVNYITVPVKDKTVDPDPLVWFVGHEAVLDGQATGQQLIEEYQKRYRPADRKTKLARVEAMKADGAKLHEVIDMAADGLCKDTYGDFNIIVQYFKALPVTPTILTPEGEEPRPWQKKIVDWALSPCPTGTDNRGCWLKMESGSGKTWILNYLSDIIEGGVFRPGIRPDGNYDACSMMHYSGESLIVFDDVGASVKEIDSGESIVCWKHKMMDMFKMVANNTPIAIDFGGAHYDITIKGKVLVTSNFSLPRGRNHEDGVALRRRYIELDVTDLERIEQALAGNNNDTAPEVGRGAWN